MSVLACTAGFACSSEPPRADAPVQQASASRASADCARGALHPSAVPPAAGMWTSDSESSGHRISAMIGPADVRTGSTLVTRTIETVEETRDAPALRARLDAAVMRVELVPPYGRSVERSSRRSPPGDGLEPAAVYALTPSVSLASYEACPGLGPAAIRYLRRDGHGRIIDDAMLHRIPSAQ